MINFYTFFNQNLLIESFKDAKNKWIRQGNDPEDVKATIDTYRQLQKKNILKGKEADIGFWMKTPFPEFKQAVDSKKDVKTGKEVRRDVGKEAEKVFAKHFPDMKDDVYGISRFIHKEWMGEMEIFK